MSDAAMPFPTSGVLPESRQIGRRSTIDRLQTQVTRNRHHTWLIAERRTGKSSVARAILDRTRAEASGTGWALRIDLKNGAVANSAEFALALAAAARGVGVEVSTPAKRLGNAGRAIAGVTARLGAAADTLGVEEGAPVKVVSDAVQQALGPQTAGGPDLRKVLAALAAAAAAEGRVAVLFIDEIQELVFWDDLNDAFFVEAQIAALMDNSDAPVVVMFAGSDGEAIKDLRVKGRPLYYQGLDFILPPIAEEDWVAGLRERFREIDVDMPREHVEHILDESKGHPLRTMSVCAQLQGLVRPDEEVLGAYVVEAVAAAKRQPSWEL